MVSQTKPKIPKIDFTKENLKQGTSSWIETSNEVKCALEEYGCFVAVYDRVSMELYNEVFESLGELFDLPKEIKVKNTCDKPYLGYVGDEPIIPLYEGFGIDDAPTLEAAQSFTNLMWPNGNDHFCKIMHSYSVLVSELEKMVKRMVFESYGVEKYYDSFMESTNYLLRIMKYRGPKMEEETNVGLTDHTDKTFMTILHQNQVNGLELKTKDGHWISFDPSPSSFVVLAGDALLAWSNNRVHSPNHRVIMSGKEERHSLGLFAFQKEMIHVPQELVDDQHPLQFKPFDNYGLLGFYYTEVGSRTECSAKAYCGV
ncbi:putative 2-oxoglutarate-dependent dioxygenase AOP1.2 [Camellia lanceoleosa]|uniref:2-oxoglutarate-dependent dioxygenase AOP1.2 n=1 Tax=Camellia lanceoleosa TaxID=1840588 RepID=A0ACC0IIA5_9ERIC|nr:putative 2-oxoglutarate-dependent dioxygenase AOP1.2 [Camellia lanceoleosa]